MDVRDELLGRVKTRGAVWAATPAQREASVLRERARSLLDGSGELSNEEMRRMIALLFTERT